jgi:hypothetical protein
MQEEVAQLCEQLGISWTKNGDGGGEPLQLAQARGRAQKARDMADERCADMAGGFEQPQPALSSGLPRTVRCQTPDVPVISSTHPHTRAHARILEQEIKR